MCSLSCLLQVYLITCSPDQESTDMFWDPGSNTDTSQYLVILLSGKENDKIIFMKTILSVTVVTVLIFNIVLDCHCSIHTN